MLLVDDFSIALIKLLLNMAKFFKRFIHNLLQPAQHATTAHCEGKLNRNQIQEQIDKEQEEWAKRNLVTVKSMLKD